MPPASRCAGTLTAISMNPSASGWVPDWGAGHDESRFMKVGLAPSAYFEVLVELYLTRTDRYSPLARHIGRARLAMPDRGLLGLGASRGRRWLRRLCRKLRLRLWQRGGLCVSS